MSTPVTEKDVLNVKQIKLDKPDVKIIYKPTSSSHLSELQAQVVGKCIEKIIEEDEGQSADLKEKLVEKAKDAKSPLHEFFEWDNTKAAHEFRLEQARLLIRSISIEVIHPKASGSQKVVRAFHSIQDDDGGRFYTTAARALTEPELKRKLLAEALMRLNQIAASYSELVELATIFSEIKRVSEKYQIE